ncbi:MAG: NTP transferase domain-containing protein, partial [Vulcanimicrobiaceae bacterium]
MNAVVTAGGRIDGPYADAAGTVVKALAPVWGTPMLGRVLEALHGAGVARVAVVGGEEVRSAYGDRIDRFVDESASGGENVLRALRAWGDDEPLLYVTSDLPYITADALRDVASRTPSGVLAMAVVEHGPFERRFPDAPAYGITLAGERVVNGGVFVIPAGAADAIARLAGTLFDARKAPWRMARLIGPTFLARLLFGRLTIGALESAAQRAVGYPSMAL